MLAQEPGAFLSSAVVFKGHRGGGLQRRMIRRRLAWARRRGAKYMVTYTIHGNWPSAYNLLRAGFKAYDPQYEYAGRAWYFQRAV
jgi:GNAT superfamily N-acetyltransferase